MNPCVVGRQNRDVRVRRMYSAKVMGGEIGKVTVAMYQGARVEEEWRQHLTIYESLRHPNIMQLYGLANTSALRAMVFHDDLIHFDQFISRFRHSPFLTAYIYFYCTSEYFRRRGTTSPVSRITSWSPADFTYWIRPASGELCVDFVERNPGSFSIVAAPYTTTPVWRNYHWTTPDAEAVITAALDGPQYHALCSSHPMARYQWLTVSTQLQFGLSNDLTVSILKMRPGSGSQSLFRYDRQNPVRCILRDTSDTSGEVLPNSWTRHNASLTYQCHLWVESRSNPAPGS
ncbi:hypothetical protein B0H14DRAFT_1275493 [Mycena olivaceomarginata]|nr:hypothetical protein B0H14DRAFT_1275493 [Mycena olivaceomarginata]